MISISQRLLSAGRRATISSTPAFTRSIGVSASVQQSVDLDLNLDENEKPAPKRAREKFVNKISLYGTVGRKPEQFGTEGKEVTIFPLLTKSYYGPVGDRMEDKSWHKIMLTNSSRGARMWALDSLDVGDKVLVTGSIFYKKIDPESPEKGKMTTILADTTILAEKRDRDEIKKE